MFKMNLKWLISILLVMISSSNASAYTFLYEGNEQDGIDYYDRLNVPSTVEGWHAQYLGCNPYRLVWYQNSHLGVVRLMRASRDGKAFSVSNYDNINVAMKVVADEKLLDRINFTRCLVLPDLSSAVAGIIEKNDIRQLIPTADADTLFWFGSELSGTNKPTVSKQLARSSTSVALNQKVSFPRVITSRRDLNDYKKLQLTGELISGQLIDLIDDLIVVTADKPLNTVSMVLNDQNEIEYAAYNEDSDRTVGVILDKEGAEGAENGQPLKSVPEVCVACHGGETIQYNERVSGGDPRTRFFVMDYNTFLFPKLLENGSYDLSGSYSDLTDNEQWILWFMNDALSQANQTVASVDGRPNGHTEYIRKTLYQYPVFSFPRIGSPFDLPLLAFPTYQTADVGRVPPDYRSDTNEELDYSGGPRQVGCNGCHYNRETNWDDINTRDLFLPTGYLPPNGNMPFAQIGHDRFNNEPVTACRTRNWANPSNRGFCFFFPGFDIPDFKTLQTKQASFPATRASDRNLNIKQNHIPLINNPVIVQ